MPRNLHSEDESDADVIPSRKTKDVVAADEEHDDEEQDDAVEDDAGNNENAADENDEEEEDDDDDAEGDGNEYVVERIVNHMFTDEGQLMLDVKWKGYEKRSDRTWEPEENCEGAKEVLEDYFKSIGGRPIWNKKTKTPRTGGKRGRQSETPASNKSKKARTATATPAKDDDDEVVAAPKEDTWKPPKGSWEELIMAVDTIEKNDKGLVCYVQWNNGKKSQHDIQTVYKKCPQKMLNFYEQHLVFKETGLVG